MKLLVFAHTPPPHHGQSYMVRLMLEGFGGDRRSQPTEVPGGYGIDCYHVNARFSSTPQQTGGFQFKKPLLLLGYCLQAIWCRFRFGIRNFYYIPAPGQRAALYRDWLVMLFCRPFFKRIIFHWHAAGLPCWLETSASGLARGFTHSLMDRVDLSIVLSQFNRVDAEKLVSKRIQIIGNGIPDPCPQFKQEILPKRLARFETRQPLLAGQAGGLHLARVLYLAHCTREKGLFDALDAIALANRRLASSSSQLRLHLTVAGEFLNTLERDEFQERLQNPDLQLPIPYRPLVTEANKDPDVSSPPSAIRYLGFISGPQKARAFAESDLFCFPTFYHAESFGLVLVEAMAFGLPIITTRWRSLPELFPPGYPGLVNIRSPDQIAQAFESVLREPTGEDLRELFLRRFTLQTFLSELAQALRTLETSRDQTLQFSA